MPSKWTPERRAAQAETMRQRHEKRRNQQPDTNPPANEDVVRVPGRSPRAARHAEEPGNKLRDTAYLSDREAPRTVAFLLGALNNLASPEGATVLSYEDCGTLLNSLSAASTAVALARRQKQEQLAAGTHRAPCNTCGRMIDISKSGGFQILTERDEHYQPRNVYYCSQNCLLAKNMPSHRVKRLPGDVGAKV